MSETPAASARRNPVLLVLELIEASFVDPRLA
jgi:hypothetical protein